MILRIQSSFDFLKIHFENENFYFANWNIISEIKIMLKIKFSFNFWSAHLRNWDFHFENHFEKVPFGTLGARDFSSAVSGFCQVFIVTRSWLRPTVEDVSAITILSWVIKNFILMVKRWFQRFHFHLLTREERIQFFVLEIKTWFYFYNYCLGS